jgi:dihydrofolate reductase
MINLIVAISRNRVIGKENKLPWHLPEDLKRFRLITNNNVVVMGRKTHLSIGKVLPNRLNVILSRDTKWYNPLGDNCVVCYSVEEVIEKFKYRDLFIIGGSEIYNQFLPYTDKIYLTLIDKDFEGDAYFPSLDDSWKEVERETLEKEDFKYHFILFNKS